MILSKYLVSTSQLIYKKPVALTENNVQTFWTNNCNNYLGDTSSWEEKQFH